SPAGAAQSPAGVELPPAGPHNPSRCAQNGVQGRPKDPRGTQKAAAARTTIARGRRSPRGGAEGFAGGEGRVGGVQSDQRAQGAEVCPLPTGHPAFTRGSRTGARSAWFGDVNAPPFFKGWSAARKRPTLPPQAARSAASS